MIMGASGSPSTNIRVMIVDDSPIVRSLIARILRDHSGIIVCASVGNGQDAINTARLEKPDIILLDHEMPVMDGLTALPTLLHDNPGTRVILCSALSEKDADITLRGLALGASDFILKPSALTGDHNRDTFRDEIIRRIRTIARRNMIATTQTMPPAGITATTPVKPSSVANPASNTTYELRADAPPLTRSAALAIGSSTGGPNALVDFFHACARRPHRFSLRNICPRPSHAFWPSSWGAAAKRPAPRLRTICRSSPVMPMSRPAITICWCIRIRAKLLYN